MHINPSRSSRAAVGSRRLLHTLQPSPIILKTDSQIALPRQFLECEERRSKQTRKKVTELQMKGRGAATCVPHPASPHHGARRGRSRGWFSRPPAQPHPLTKKVP